MVGDEQLKTDFARDQEKMKPYGQTHNTYKSDQRVKRGLI